LNGIQFDAERLLSGRKLRRIDHHRSTSTGT
jgi:hypothetical protein